jgi:YegS/Rv2252/BmrU family lipid kinase
VVRTTTGPADGRRLTQELLLQGYDLIIVVGGDGTANEVLNGYHDSPPEIRARARLALIPMGTGCDLARSLGYETMSPRQALLGLTRPQSRVLDYATAEVRIGDRVESRCFLNVASCGFSAQTVSNVGRLARRLNGTLAYFAAAIRTLTQLKNPGARVEVDGRLFYEGRMLLLAAANGQYFGGSMMIAPLAGPQTGSLALVLITSLGRLGVVRHIGKLYGGRHMSLPQVLSARARQIRVTSLDAPRVPVETDGELAGTLDATFTVVPAGVTLAVPDR